jgi:hypothetical protein
MQSDEVWLPVASYESVYEVSNMGRVRNAKGKLLSQQLVNSGYMVVHLYNSGKHTRRIASVHRLVAKAFVANPANKPEVNHDDGIKTNNISSNLVWSTRQENVTHSIANGLIPPDVKMQAVIGVCKLSKKSIVFKSMTDAEINLSGKKTSAIGHSMRRENGSAYGYTWQVNN